MGTSESEVRLQSRATTEKFPIRKAKRRTSRANGQKGKRVKGPGRALRRQVTIHRTNVSGEAMRRGDTNPETRVFRSLARCAEQLLDSLSFLFGDDPAEATSSWKLLLFFLARYRALLLLVVVRSFTLGYGEGIHQVIDLRAVKPRVTMSR